MSLNTPGRIPRRLAGGMTSEVAAYTGPARELVIDEELKRVHLQDGATPGGIALLRADEAPDPKAALTYPTRAAAIATNIPPVAMAIRLLGYAAAGDGGEAVYTRLGGPPVPAKVWHFQSEDGAWWGLAANRRVNVRVLGAKGDGATDDTAAFLGAVDLLSTTGGTVHIPAGSYKITQTIDVLLDKAAVYDAALTINLVGDGSGNTHIINATPLIVEGVAVDQPTFRVKGGSPALGSAVDLHWRGFTILASTPYRGLGAVIDFVAFAMFEDIVTRDLFMHWQLVDTLSCTWVRSRMRYGAIGVDGFLLAADGSTTNALTFIGSQIHMMYQHAVRLIDAINFTMVGGSIEGCGIDLGNGHVGNSTRCPILLNPNGAGVGATLTGVYFESNAGLATIRAICGPQWSGSLNALGCSFANNIADQFVTNHVRVDTDANQLITVNLSGSGFWNAGGYVPDPGRKDFAAYGGGRYKLHDDGVVWSSDLARPDEYSPDPAFMAFFNGATAALARGRNVASVTRVGAGHYRLNLSRPWRNIDPIMNVSAIDPVVASFWAWTPTTFEFKVVNLSGAAVDPSQVSVSVWD